MSDQNSNYSIAPSDENTTVSTTTSYNPPDIRPRQPQQQQQQEQQQQQTPNTTTASEPSQIQQSRSNNVRLSAVNNENENENDSSSSSSSQERGENQAAAGNSQSALSGIARATATATATSTAPTTTSDPSAQACSTSDNNSSNNYNNHHHQNPHVIETPAAAAVATNSADIYSSKNHQNEQAGGRLWKLACELVKQQEQGHPIHPAAYCIAPPPPSSSLSSSSHTAGMQPHYHNVGHNSNSNVRGGQQMLAATLRERMQSRANPDAPCVARRQKVPPSRTPTATTLPGVKQQLDMVAQDEEEQFLLLSSSSLAHKRVKVAQLLIIGIIGILFGWLGNAVVGTHCHFASVQVEVGQNGDLFSLHFGLYKYSTVDSSLNGFKYCYPYGGQHENDAPVLARAVNILAFLSGTYSLVILWWYLIVGQFRHRPWRWAVWSAVAAGIFQLATLLFFAGHLCHNNTCVPGPASFLTLVTALTWVLLGWELHYNMPSNSTSSDNHLVDDDENSSRSKNNSNITTKEPLVMAAHLEMADLAVASQEYMERFQHTNPRREGYQPPELS